MHACIITGISGPIVSLGPSFPSDLRKYKIETLVRFRYYFSQKRVEKWLYSRSPCPKSRATMVMTILTVASLLPESL